jgi:hypothetical protein
VLPTVVGPVISRRHAAIAGAKVGEDRQRLAELDLAFLQLGGARSRLNYWLRRSSNASLVNGERLHV